MAKAKVSYIQIVPKNGAMGIRVGYPLFINKEEEDVINYFIPGFDLFFSAPTEEIGEKRGKAMVRAFVNHGVKMGPQKFFLEIHKLGFRSPQHNYIMNQFLHKKIAPAKFSTKLQEAPANFGHGDVVNEEFELA